MSLMANANHPKTAGLLNRFFSRLRFPWLFAVVAVLFGIDLILPDVVPFIDELLLAAGTVLLGAWKQRKTERTDDSSAAGE